MPTDFDFGKNWAHFSETSLDGAKFEAARASLTELLGEGALRKKRFLDIGCGTGIFAIAALSLGASEAVGIDVNSVCIQTSRKNADWLGASSGGLRFRQMSILDAAAVESLGQFDIVYAWGSLHHTGRLWEAFSQSASRVGPSGTWVVALYNRHWTSPAWRLIKRTYNLSPGWIQRIFGRIFCAVIYVAKGCATGKDPLKKDRGMDFYHDVIDWIGGYPYQTASVEEAGRRAEALGFRVKRAIPAETPTGCNQWVFTRTS